MGLVFLPGKGDGTFGTAVPLAPETFSPTITPLLLAADLNNDHKLDLLWNRSIYLGNGDGTFHKSTVPLPGPVLAVGDLNGDGIPPPLQSPSQSLESPSRLASAPQTSPQARINRSPSAHPSHQSNQLEP